MYAIKCARIDPKHLNEFYFAHVSRRGMEILVDGYRNPFYEGVLHFSDKSNAEDQIAELNFYDAGACLVLTVVDLDTVDCPENVDVIDAVRCCYDVRYKATRPLALT